MIDGFDLDIPIPETEKTIVSTGERTQALNPIKCPVCGTDNIPGEEWCVDCGFELNSEPGESVEETIESPRLLDEKSGQEFRLIPGENRIGREGPEIVLTDPSVSRHHARIILEDSAVWLEDAGSTNGTRIDDVRLSAGERKALKGGEILRFGKASLKMVFPDGFTVTTSEESDEEDDTASEPVAWLIAADGSEYAVPGSSVTVGRRQGNGIVISGDAYVSGLHGQFLYQDTQFSYVDLGSTNGSLVNGQRVIPDQPISLTDGDKLTIGRSAFVFKVGDPYQLNHNSDSSQGSGSVSEDSEAETPSENDSKSETVSE